MKKKVYLFLGSLLLLVGCSKTYGKEIINYKDSENFYYNLNLNHREDLKTIKSNGEFLEIKLEIKPKSDYKYEDVKVKIILEKEIKKIFVEGIDKEFETSSTLTIAKNEFYDNVSLSSIFSLESIEDINNIDKIFKREGIEVLVKWKDGEENVLIKK